MHAHIHTHARAGTPSHRGTTRTSDDDAVIVQVASSVELKLFPFIVLRLCFVQISSEGSFYCFSKIYWKCVLWDKLL